MPEDASILSVRVKKASRDICNFQCLDNKEDFTAGTCQFKWRILEPGDGAVLQIIYAGGSQHDPRLHGTVEGQSDGIVVEKYALGESNSIARTTISMIWIGPVVILMAIAGSLIYVATKIERSTEAAKRLAEEREATKQRLAELTKIAKQSTRPIVWKLMVAAISILLVAIWLLVWSHSSPGPPFGW
jgi:hypothetical protein